MPTTTGFYQTENGSKYLQQLCKHFGHKIETSYDSEKGWAAFEMGLDGRIGRPFTENPGAVMGAG